MIGVIIPFSSSKSKPYTVNICLLLVVSNLNSKLESVDNNRLTDILPPVTAKLADKVMSQLAELDIA